MSNSPKIPSDLDEKTAKFLRQLIVYYDNALRSAVSSNTAVGGILMVSSGNYVYRVTVDDAGDLQTELVQEP